MADRTPITRLEEHPNLSEVLEVLARLPQITDSDLTALAACWINDSFLAEARGRALSPDSPLVCEVLAAFGAVGELFEDDLNGNAAAPELTPPLVSRALKAVCDAIAASYGRPVLSGAEHGALMLPWRTVFATSTIVEPDLGPLAEQVKALLAALPRLATRCHDPAGLQLWETLVDQSFLAETERADALLAAFDVALLTSRRRLWALVRRSGEQSLSQGCPRCRRRQPDRADSATQRVTELCLGAACALLVADALPEATTALLTAPVSSLLPAQRPAGPSS